MATTEPRRFRMEYGAGDDGAGYVIRDHALGGRGKIVFRSDSRGDTEQKVDALNAEEAETVHPTRECPTCGRDVRVIDGKVERHRQVADADEYGDRQPWCSRGTFSYLPSEGWLVLVGAGYPVRVEEPDIDEMSVQWFPDELAARRWIEAHPKAKGAQPIELVGEP